MRCAAALIALVAALPAAAETVMATRTIRAQAVIGPGDVTVKDIAVPGAFADPAQVIGQEARVALYAGRPLRPGDVGPPSLIDRNQIVVLVYETSALSIVTDGRSLGRGGVGDRIRVMNLSSRQTVSGTIRADGSVAVSN